MEEENRGMLLCTVSIKYLLDGVTFVSTAFNMLAWSLDVAGDLVGFHTKTHNCAVAMNLSILLSCGLTPIVYMAGGQDTVKQTTSSGEKKKISDRIIAALKRENI